MMSKANILEQCIVEDALGSFYSEILERREMQRIGEYMNEINNIISTISAIIAFVSLIVTLYYNHKTRKEYWESLKPVLGFNFYERDAVLYLKVSNMGQSGAVNINVDIQKLVNNGDGSIDMHNMFEYDTFDLYPTESIEAIISTLEAHLLTEHPIIFISVSYTEQISGKQQAYERKVICNRS